MQPQSLTKIFSTNQSQKYCHQSDNSCNQNLLPKYSPPINHRNIANNLIIISSKISHQNIIAIINCQKQLLIGINLAALIAAWSKNFLWGIKKFDVEPLRVFGLPRSNRSDQVACLSKTQVANSIFVCLIKKPGVPVKVKKK